MKRLSLFSCECVMVTCILFQSLAPVGQQVLARMRRAWQVASRHIRQYRMNITIQMSENIGARILVVYDVGTTWKIT